MLTGATFTGLAVFNQKLSVYMIHIVPYYVAVLTVWIWHLWSKGTARVRIAVALFVAVLIVVEVSGVVLRAQLRSYIGAERALVTFVRAHASPKARIFGSASLSFGLHFDPRLVDDPYLGTRSGEIPDFIIVDKQFYEALYEDWSRQGKQEMPAITGRVEAYKKVFDNQAYRVYVHPGAKSAGTYVP